MPFDFEKTPLDSVVLVKPRVYKDDRGFFMETYKKSAFEANGVATDFVQDNHSRSTKGVLRGLHYQLDPFAQGKLVRCLHGVIYDVAVDIRKSSPNFGKWVGYELSEENRHMLWIPEGFAHAFLTLSDTAEMAYKVSGSEYCAAAEGNIIWNDPDLSIDWPFKEGIHLASKDGEAPLFKYAKVFE